MRLNEGQENCDQKQLVKNLKMMKTSPRVSVDPEGCISLSHVLHSFTSGVNEEQAWALCYQIIKTAQLVLNADEEREGVPFVTETEHVKLHQDGSVHKNTFLRQDTAKGPPRNYSTDECKIISQLVHVIYEALEFGTEEDSERALSPELENFLGKMIDADESGERLETDDEGISSDDSEDEERKLPERTFNFLAVLRVCRERLGSSQTNSVLSHSGSLSSLSGNGSTNNRAFAQADNHYKAVIRALVAETLELSTFLEKVAQGTNKVRAAPCNYRGGSGGNSGHQEEPRLDCLHFTVWARLWVQVIHDLRNGVKLKKVESFEFELRGPPIEYELTPYEILMDDIRSRRYKLKQVMVDGELPQRVKRDAHELILEFIRGRSPLRKVADRVLPPAPQKRLPPIEALMESIRTQDPHNLRPTKTIVRNSIRTGFLLTMETGTGKRGLETASEDEAVKRKLEKVSKVGLEVCVDNIQSVIKAAEGGAIRIELCSALSEGGLTPTPGLLKLGKTLVDIPIFAMIRPRCGDFVYSEHEIEVMLADIEFLKELGADGFVFGVLDKTGNVDVKQCAKLLKAAEPLPCTFHRAFDLVAKPNEALQKIIELGFARILTSGQAATAPEGSRVLKDLVKKAGENIIIMAGAGINPQNVEELIRTTKVKEVHGSGRVKVNSSIKTQQSESHVSMGKGKDDDSAHYETSKEIIQEIVSKISSI